MTTTNQIPPANVELDAGDTTRIRRVPRDIFEEALFRRVIQHEIDQWNALPNWMGTAELSTEPWQAGVWRLFITQRQELFDPASLLSTPQVAGYVWLAENPNTSSLYHRTPVTHYFPAQEHLFEQSNEGYPPVIAWDLAAP